MCAAQHTHHLKRAIRQYVGADASQIPSLDALAPDALYARARVLNTFAASQQPDGSDVPRGLCGPTSVPSGVANETLHTPNALQGVLQGVEIRICAQVFNAVHQASWKSFKACGIGCHRRNSHAR